MATYVALRVQRSNVALTSRKRRLCALAIDSSMAAVRAGVRLGSFDNDKRIQSGPFLFLI